MTPNAASAPSAADRLSPTQFIRFRDLIEGRCGLHLAEIHRGSLWASLRIHMTQLKLTRIDAYYDYLRSRSADGAFATLINLLTVTETRFFRDPAQFRLLRHLLSTLVSQRDAGSRTVLRIWSAGCATGEEAYSIAMTLWDMGLYAANPPCSFEILGTDVNTEAIEAARRAVYSPRALRNVDSAGLRRHFRRVGDQFQLKDETRRRVRFEYGNLARLTKARPPSGYDLVFCKNVAIYFRPERARALIRQLAGMVADGGYLLLGHSEALVPSDGFTLVEHDGAFCYRNGAAMPARRVKARPVRSAETAGSPYESCLAAFRAESWAEAEALLRRLIASSPQFVPAYLLLGGVYAHRGRYAEARDQAHRALRLDDLEPKAYLLQGMIASRSGDQDEARDSLRRALYLNARLALAHFWLGNLYRDQGDVGRARAEYENVVRDWERHALDFTEEFASDLAPEQVVEFCRTSLQRLIRPE